MAPVARPAVCFAVSLTALFLSACGANPPVASKPAPANGARSGVPSARVAELEQQVARLELRLLERDAQIEELQTRLDEARQEVVRVMAKLQTAAARAEAASGMAEAEVALQALRSAARSEAVPEVLQARQLLEMSGSEFNKDNYGGALYLANQAKSLAAGGRSRLLSGRREALRPGETVFVVPVRLDALGRGNVRDGPGTSFKVLFVVAKGTTLVGHAYAGEWVRVSDETGRTGWMFHSLVGRRQSGGT